MRFAPAPKDAHPPVRLATPLPTYSNDPPTLRVCIEGKDQPMFTIDAAMWIARSGYASGFLGGGFTVPDPLPLPSHIISEALFPIYLHHLVERNLPETLSFQDLFKLYAMADFLVDDVLSSDIVRLIHERMHFFRCLCPSCAIEIPKLWIWASHEHIDSVKAGLDHVLHQAWDIMISQYPKSFLALKETHRDHLLMDLVDTLSPRTIFGVLHRVLLTQTRIEPQLHTLRSLDTNESIRVFLDVLEESCHDMILSNLALFLRNSELSSQSSAWEKQDTLTHVLHFIASTLKDDTVVLVWEALLAPVLSSIAGMECVRDLKEQVLRYMKKRWPSIAAVGGFNLMSPEKLSMLAEQIQVSRQDLVVSCSDWNGDITRTGLRAVVTHVNKEFIMDQPSNIAMSTMVTKASETLAKLRLQQRSRPGNHPVASSKKYPQTAPTQSSAPIRQRVSTSTASPKSTSAKPMVLFKHGDVVSLSDNRQGVVKYVGQVDFAPGIWVGVDLDSKFVGKNDGTVDGKMYFKTRHNAKSGVFVKPSSIQKSI